VNNHDEELLAELLLQWEELYERGQDSSPQELCRDCPYLTEEFGKRIAAMKATNWLNNPDCPAESPTAPASQSAGKVLGGRYRLDDLIATGGFAEVWRAFDTELQRIVAIKLPKPNRLASATNFITEARRVARLKHPGIVPVFDVGTEGTNCFIVSEYVEGGSLGDRLTKSPQSPKETSRWLGEIAAALEYAHLHGVIHRDIKPANILIDHHGRALLADFGIAQSAQKTGTFAPSLGTLRYMSPEQLEGKAATPQSDVYSLGVVLHECLTGRLPYSSSEPSVLRREIVGGAKQLSKDVPAALLDVCQKAMKRLPHERHTSAAHFATELDKAAGIVHSRPPGWWSVGLLTILLASVLSLSLIVFGIGIAFKLPPARRSEGFAASAQSVNNAALQRSGKPVSSGTLAPIAASRAMTTAEIRQHPFADVLVIADSGLTVAPLKETARVCEGDALDTFGRLPSDLVNLDYSLLPKSGNAGVGILFNTAGRAVIGTDWHQRNGFLEQKWTAYLAKQAVQRSLMCGGLQLWDVVAKAGDTVLVPSSCVVMSSSIDTTQQVEAHIAKPVPVPSPCAEVLIDSARPMPLGIVGDPAFNVKGQAPEDLDGLQYAVHGTNGPLPASEMALVITFKTAGRIAYLSAWRGGMPELTALDDCSMRFVGFRRENERLGDFDIWDIVGKPGERIVVPEWGKVLAKDIEVRVMK